MNKVDDKFAAGTTVDLKDLEIETFEIETLSELGVAVAVEELLDITVSTTSSTTSGCCG